MRVRRQIRFAEKPEPIYGIRPVPFALRKPPTTIVADRINYAHTEHRLETLQMANDDRPMRPRTRPGNVKMISTRFRQKSARSISRDPISKCIVLADKLA